MEGVEKRCMNMLANRWMEYLYPHTDVEGFLFAECLSTGYDSSLILFGLDLGLMKMT